MTRKIYNKLVRDKIPQIIISNNSIPKTRKLRKSEYREELKKKLFEEVKEVNKEDADILDELADVLELVKSIGAEYDIEYTDIQKRQIKKNKERGGFVNKIYLEWVDEKN